MIDGTSTILTVCNKIIEEIQSIELYGGDIKVSVSYVKLLLTKRFPMNDSTTVKHIGNVCDFHILFL